MSSGCEDGPGLDSYIVSATPPQQHQEEDERQSLLARIAELEEANRVLRQGVNENVVTTTRKEGGESQHELGSTNDAQRIVELEQRLNEKEAKLQTLIAKTKDVMANYRVCQARLKDFETRLPEQDASVTDSSMGTNSGREDDKNRLSTLQHNLDLAKQNEAILIQQLQKERVEHQNALETAREKEALKFEELSQKYSMLMEKCKQLFERTKQAQAEKTQAIEANLELGAKIQEYDQRMGQLTLERDDALTIVEALNETASRQNILQDEVQSKAQKIEELQRQLGDQAESLSQCTEQCASFSTQVASLTHELEHTRLAVANADHTLQQALRAELDDCKRTLAEALQELEEEKKAHVDLLAVKTRTDERLQEIIMEQQSLEEKVLSLESQVESGEMKIKDLECQLRSKSGQLANAIDEYEKATLKSEDVSKLQQQLEQTTAQLEQSRLASAAQDTQIQEHREARELVCLEVKRLEFVNADLLRRVDAVQNMHADVVQELAHTQKEQGIAATSYEEQQLELERTRQHVLDLEKQLAEVNQSHRDVHGAQEALKLELEQTKSKLRQVTSDFELRIEAEQTTITDLQQQLAHTKGELAEALADTMKSQAALHTKEEREGKLNSQLQELLRGLEHAATVQSDLQLEVAQDKLQLSEYKSNLEAAEGKVADLEQEMAHSRQQIEYLTDANAEGLKMLRIQAQRVLELQVQLQQYTPHHEHAVCTQDKVTLRGEDVTDGLQEGLKVVASSSEELCSIKCELDDVTTAKVEGRKILQETLQHLQGVQEQYDQSAQLLLTLQDQVMSKESQLKQTRASLVATEVQLQERSDLCATLTQQIESLQNQNAELSQTSESKINGMISKMRSLFDDVKSLRTENEFLSAQLAESSTINKSLECQIAEFKTSVSKLLSAKTGLEETCTKLQQAMETKTTELRELEGPQRDSVKRAEMQERLDIELAKASTAPEQEKRDEETKMRRLDPRVLDLTLQRKEATNAWESAASQKEASKLEFQNQTSREGETSREPANLDEAAHDRHLFAGVRSHDNATFDASNLRLESDSRFHDLKRELEQRTHEYEDAKRANKALEFEIMTLRKQLEDRIIEFNQRCEASTQAQDDLKTQLYTPNQLLRNITDQDVHQLETVRPQLQEVAEALPKSAEIEQEINSVGGWTNPLVGDRSASRIKELEEQLIFVHEEHQSALDDIAVTASKAAEFQAMFESAVTEIENLRKQKEEAESLRDQAEELIQALRMDVQRADMELVAQLTRTADMEDELLDKRRELQWFVDGRAPCLDEETMRLLRKRFSSARKLQEDNFVQLAEHVTAMDHRLTALSRRWSLLQHNSAIRDNRELEKLAAKLEDSSRIRGQLEMQIEDASSARIQQNLIWAQLQIQLEEAIKAKTQLTQQLQVASKSAADMQALSQSMAAMQEEHEEALRETAEGSIARVQELEAMNNDSKLALAALQQKHAQMLERFKETVVQLKALQSEKQALGTQVAELNKSLTSSKRELEDAQNRLIERNHTIEETTKRETHIQDIEDRDAQLASYADHVEAMAKRNEALTEECHELRSKLTSATYQIQQTNKELDMESFPDDFNVIKRFDDNGTVWCLVRALRRDTDDETPRISTTWYQDAVVLQWITRLHEARSDSSSTDPDSLARLVKQALPPTVQQEAREQLHNVSQQLQSRIDALQSELEQNTQAFNVYRTRAHVALKKTAQEQQLSEEKIAHMQSELREQQEKWKRTEKRLRSVDKTRKAKLQQLEQDLQEEHSTTEEIRKQLKVVTDAIGEIRVQSEEGFQKFQALYQGQINEAQEKVKRFEQLNAKLTSEVERARKELKSRGDVARRLLSEKDDEIKRLRERVRLSGPSSDTLLNLKSPRIGGLGLGPSTQEESHHSQDEDGVCADEAITEEEQIMMLAKLQAQRDEITSGLRRQLDEAKAAIEVKEKEVKQISDQVAKIRAESAQLTSGQIDSALSDRLTYLKSALVGYVRASRPAEKAAHGRVMATILSLNDDEIRAVVESSNPAPLDFSLSSLNLFGSRS